MESSITKELDRSAHNWWLSVLIGGTMILMGIWCIITPITTFEALSLLFSLFFLIGGVVEISIALVSRHISNGWGWQLAVGIIDLILGIVLISNQIIASITFLSIVIFWLLFQMILSLGLSIELIHQKVSGAVWGVIISILGFLLVLILLMNPVLLAGTIVYMFSGYVIVYGALRVYYGFKLKKLIPFIENHKK